MAHARAVHASAETLALRGDRRRGGRGSGGRSGSESGSRYHAHVRGWLTWAMGAHLGTDVGRPGVSRRGETRAAVGRVETRQARWTLPRERCVSTTQRASALVAGPGHGARPFPGIVARPFGRCSRRRRLAPLRLASADRVRVHAEVRRGLHHDPRPQSTTTPDGSRRTPVRFFCVPNPHRGVSGVKKKRIIAFFDCLRRNQRLSSQSERGTLTQSGGADVVPPTFM